MAFTIRAADLFCGAGGASTGLVRAADALGLCVDLLAVNHWPVAVATHSLNHPGVRHLCETVDKINPREAVPGGRLHLLLAGPECTHHSSARGGKPINDQSRTSAWHILKWAQELYIDTILIENVPEFRTWGPLGVNNRPIKRKKGQTYRAFLEALRSLDYTVEERIINAADYGDPTTRRRLFILAQRGRRRVAFPMPTHSPAGDRTLFGQTKRWKAAREVIDWRMPGKSIFNRKKPLAPATMQRIIAGLDKFSGPELQPFLVVLRNHMNGQSVDAPLPTITTAKGGELAVVSPYLVQTSERRRESVGSVEEPIRTITALGGRCFGLAQPFLTKYNGTARERAYSVEDPLDTISTKDRFGLVQPVVDGYVLDIHFRMLQPHELASAMSFPTSYQFTGKREDVVKQIGNAWAGETAKALCASILQPYAARKGERWRSERTA